MVSARCFYCIDSIAEIFRIEQNNCLNPRTKICCDCDQSRLILTYFTWNIIVIYDKMVLLSTPNIIATMELSEINFVTLRTSVGMICAIQSEDAAPWFQVCRNDQLMQTILMYYITCLTTCSCLPFQKI